MRRRDFVRNSAGALLATHPVFSTLARHREPGAQPSPVKSLSEYRADAAQFETAVRDLSTVPTMPAVTDAELSRITALVEKAGANLDLMESWKVMVCFNDPGLVAWVRKEIRDEAAAVKFLDDVRRNPRIVDTIPAMTALITRLEQLKAEKVGLVRKIVEKERQIAGMEASAADKAKQAEDAAKCQAIWSIIAAVVLVVVAVVVTVVTMGAGAGALLSVAIGNLATTYAGTGSEAVLAKLRVINANYVAVVASIATATTAQSQTPAALAKAVAARQAAWLSDKVVFLT